MTIREIANFVDKNNSTIGRWIKRTENNALQTIIHNVTKANPADFTLEEGDFQLNH